jgi:APA family basic amino acid/polyamine antiporter
MLLGSIFLLIQGGVNFLLTGLNQRAKSSIMVGTNKELLRVPTLKDAIGIGIGAIIGAGIFVVTGVAAGVSAPSFVVGLIIAGIMATFNGLSTAQLAVVYPYSGGAYIYGYHLLNPALGFSAGWMFLISKLAAAGVVAIGFIHCYAWGCC